MSPRPGFFEGTGFQQEERKLKESYDEEAARRAITPLREEICESLGGELVSWKKEYTLTKGNQEIEVVFAPPVFTEQLAPEHIRHIFIYNKETGIYSSITIAPETQIPTHVRQQGLHHSLEVKRESDGSYAVDSWESTELTKDMRVGKPLRGGSLGIAISYKKERGLEVCIGTYQRPSRLKRWRQQFQRLHTGEVQDMYPVWDSIVFRREGDKFRLASGESTRQYLSENGIEVRVPGIEKGAVGKTCRFEIVAKEQGGFNMTRNVPLEMPSIGRLVRESSNTEKAASIS